MVWFQISWASTTSNEQNSWNVYRPGNHAVTRTIHSSSEKSDSDKHLHSIPAFATSFLPHCCPPTNHFPHLLRQEALYKDTPVHHSATKTECASQHIPVHTASLLSFWTTTPDSHLEVKHFCFHQTTAFHMKRIYTCKIDWSGWTSTYFLLWTHLVSITIQEEPLPSLFDHTLL